MFTGAVPAWRRGWRDVVIDVAPAVGLWGAGLLDAARFDDFLGDARPASSLIPMTIACALLLLRRRWPLPVLCAIVLVLVVPAWVLPVSLGFWGEFIVWMVALYSCARHEDHAVRRVAGLLVSAATLTAIAIRFPQMADLGDMSYDGALLTGAWALGLFARSWSRYRDDAVRQELERTRVEERAVHAERDRIARELHDVISHTITVIVMQAGGARLASASDPGAAIEALARIERLGQDSLGELRTMLTVLRGVDEPPTASAPQPKLADIPALCERTRELGLPVTLEMAEPPDALPAGVQLAGYRVVQEGLTNVLKHAGAVETRVSIRPERGVLVVTVSNDPGRTTEAAPSGRRGLIGLRERVCALGGNFSATTLPDGGFVISAELPARQASAGLTVGRSR